MKNFIKKTSVNVLVAVLILNFFGFAALAADEITIELSADSGYVGSSVTVVRNRQRRTMGQYQGYRRRRSCFTF